MIEKRTDATADPHEPDYWAVLEQLDAWLRVPMLVLSFVWLALVIVELAGGSSRLIEVFGTIIWIIFIVEFLVRLALAPDKWAFLKGNWLSVLALVAPAIRLVRIFRVLRLARGARALRLVRIVGTANRSMNALRASLGRRGFGFVALSTVLVAMLGAGGMLAFEPATEVNGGFSSYADALWWTAMLLTSLGSDFWPKTLEGRVLCFLLSLYGFAVFGYMMGIFASFFIGRDAAASDAEIASATAIADLRADIARLRHELGNRPRGS